MKKYVFEWDSGNISKMDLVKESGRIFSLSEIESVFDDKRLIVQATTLDPLTQEQRYIAIGVSNQNRVISVIFVVRNGRIRPFNVWKTKGSKLKMYNENAQ